MNLIETKIPYLDKHYPVLKRLEHSDREIISWYAEKYNQFSCEFSFPSLYLWDDIYHYKLSFFNDWLIVFDTRNDYILIPMGKEISLSGLLTLSISLKQDGYSGDISNVPPEIIARHPELGHYYDIENERGLAEYIYSTEKLVALRGKKLRKKKNHISQFLQNYPDYQVRPMDPTVRKDCLVMIETMLAENQTVSNSIREEAIVIRKGFESFDSIPLEGIAIYIKNDTESKLVGFSVYSRLNKDIFTIHFEKVNYSYRGAAQVINWETAKVLKDKCRYINREQDLGIPGLRKAKLSYEPELIYPANFLRFKNLTTDIAGI
ncbi:MAG: DUF2156 domain-containing protein [gamma proteobacterium symbiont of Taylorina sp.]|nr:DUF2156 domain-containing protein [gamma proteobacterium symbiont of Taylorina sp.]